jgi:hypothetical protein
MVQTKLEDFRAVLITFVDGVEFGERLACHAQLCVAAGGLQLPFKLHSFVFSTSLAKAVAGICGAMHFWPADVWPSLRAHKTGATGEALRVQ